MRPNLLTSLCVVGALALGGAAFAQAPSTSTPAAAPKASTSMMKAAPAKAPLLDINTASKDELKDLKGVGDKRADDIKDKIIAKQK